MNEMMESIEKFDNKNLPIRHIPGPEGVRGRNSDNELILEKLGWEPTIKLNDGLKLTYDWIKTQLAEVREPPTLNTPEHCPQKRSSKSRA
jgi:GDP-D-mannose 3',5'-epimerase